ncbi:ABC transporter ATP-binding protein [Aestuariimicrobium ganziense]|uniref:ABC transporter ATP-binding protein n=1 Tax=Aestuariimicrobium ganziense TaxID=2773677 RepID=UPI001943EF00|nr:ABC transporter ATP-binding protein [Aestuariimicrobium ganziense]
MPDHPALLVEDAAVSFGTTVALDGLDLRAERGQVTALLGPNGAGKTTLIRACTGLLDLDRGRISLFGLPPGHPDVLPRVGLMPQSTGAWSGITAAELLSHLSKLYSHPLDVAALMDELQVTTYARTPYRRLSGGQQQAVNLAGALVGRPEMVVLDEPTSGMDPHARRRTWRLVERLREAGLAVLLTTHAMDEAQALADTVHIVDRGRVVLSGSVAELTDEHSLEELFLAHTSGDT